MATEGYVLSKKIIHILTDSGISLFNSDNKKIWPWNCLFGCLKWLPAQKLIQWVVLTGRMLWHHRPKSEWNYLALPSLSSCCISHPKQEVQSFNTEFKSSVPCVEVRKPAAVNSSKDTVEEGAVVLYLCCILTKEWLIFPWNHRGKEQVLLRLSFCVHLMTSSWSWKQIFFQPFLKFFLFWCVCARVCAQSPWWIMDVPHPDFYFFKDVGSDTTLPIYLDLQPALW